MPIRFLFVFTFWFISVTAFGLTEGRVTVDSLNLRKLPDGEIIGKLPIDQTVKLVAQNSGWSQILFLDDDSDEALYGWVSSKYIELQPEIVSTECKVNAPDNSEYCLTMIKPNLQCQLAEQTENFSACTVDIRYELSGSQAQTKGLIVVCTSDMKTRNHQNQDWQAHTQTANTYHGESLTAQTSGSVEINFEFGAESRVKYFRLTRSVCELELVDIPDQATHIYSGSPLI